jgi:hypothetical protein
MKPVMGIVIQARLDERSQKRLRSLVRELGLTPSEAVREGIRALESTHLRKKKRTIVGLGKFDSGIPDLGSNKKHLDGYGE